MRVAVCGFHLEHALLDSEQRDVERAAAKVKDEDILLALLAARATCLRPAPVESIRNGRRSGLVEDTQHLESCDGAGVFRGLPLCVVEVGRYRDYCIFDGLPEEGLGDRFHPLHHHRTNFLGREHLRLAPRPRRHLDEGPAAHVHHLERPQLPISRDDLIFEIAADETLGIVDCARGIARGLGLRSVPD
mmetsp:Transcript_21892/g.55526  ORF Transcript_21892/g.55526 Transcript_21892/m.55526 type:complete len:189 (-) Transcript_21892:489-1055(-)